MIGYGHKSLPCFISKFWLTIEKITNPLNLATPHSSSQLMELCQSEIFGLIDDDSIRIEKVDTIFDDGCGEENIVISELKFHDPIFKFIRWELTIGDHHFCFWYQCFDFFFENRESLDRIMNKKYFASPGQFFLNSTFYNRLIIPSNRCMNWFFSLRRGGEN